MNRAREGGFTLIEMILVIVIGGIIAVVGAQMLGGTFSAYFVGRDTVVRDWNARVALERMSRELRAARSATSNDIDIASSTQLRFIDTDGASVCYYASGTTLMRSDDFAAACGTTNPQPLADGISNLSFGYYQQNGAVAATADAVTFITVSFTASQNNVSEAMRATVNPRNF